MGSTQPSQPQLSYIRSPKGEALRLRCRGRALTGQGRALTGQGLAGRGLGGAGRAGDLNFLSAESSARAEVAIHQISPRGPETSGPQFRLERWWKDQVVL